MRAIRAIRVTGAIIAMAALWVLTGQVTTGFAALSASSTSISIKVGATHSFSISGGTGFVKISSSDTTVATATISGQYSEKGTITGIAQGSAVITIQDASGDKVTITVQVSEITVSQNSLVLAVNESGTVKVLTGSGFYNVTSSDDTIATAKVYGDTITVTGTATGAAMVSVTDSNGNTVTISVTVGAAAGSPVSVTVPFGIGVNETKDIDLTGVGSGFYQTTVSDPTVAEVVIIKDTAGSKVTASITGLSKGTATITIQDSVGNQLILDLTVAAFTVSQNTLTLEVGETRTVTFSGGSGYYQSTLSSPGAVTVSILGSSAEITGTAVGTCAVKIEDSDGASVTISVTVTAFSVSPDSVDLGVGGTATVTLSGGSGYYQASVSDTAVASVSVLSDSVEITGKSAGTATVTITDAGGSKVTIDVTVTEISLSQTSVTLKVQESAVVDILSSGSFYNISSSSSSVATAGVAGTTITITGKSAGSAVITVENSSGQTAQIQVTVGSAVSADLQMDVGEVSVQTLTGSGYYSKVNSDSTVAVAVIDNTGAADTLEITAVSPGKAVITITDHQGQTFDYTVVVRLSPPVLAVSVSGNQVALNWSPVSGAGSYFLYYAPVAAGGGPDYAQFLQFDLGAGLGPSGVGNLSYTVSPGDHFFVALQAIHSVYSDVYSPLSTIEEIKIP